MSDPEVPDDRIEVTVADGWLTLKGEVKHQYESNAAFEAVSGSPAWAVSQTRSGSSPPALTANEPDCASRHRTSSRLKPSSAAARRFLRNGSRVARPIRSEVRHVAQRYRIRRVAPQYLDARQLAPFQERAHRRAPVERWFTRSWSPNCRTALTSLRPRRRSSRRSKRRPGRPHGCPRRTVEAQSDPSGHSKTRCLPITPLRHIERPSVPRCQAPSSRRARRPRPAIAHGSVVAAPPGQLQVFGKHEPVRPLRRPSQGRSRPADILPRAQRLPDVVAQRGKKWKAHPAADADDVGQLEKATHDPDLFAELDAPEHGDQRSCRLHPRSR